MARMLPPQVADGTPMSERRIFELLRKDPDTDDWVVLHSLGLRRTRIGPYGEIDFVILVPGKGIACLEVKGGEVSCSDGIWKTRNRKTGKTATLNKSPYMQAREGMFALRSAIEDKFGLHHPASGCPTAFVVVFPDVPAPPASSEAEKWETIDLRSLREPVSKLVGRTISNTRKKLTRKFTTDNTSLGTMGEIKRFLRPDFERVVARSTSIARSEEQLIALTEEQYRYLDIAEVNDQVVVTGAAGTGKTLLGLEYARREAVSGRSVLLLCFNRVLGRWLKTEIASQACPGISAETFHSFLHAQIIGSSYRAEFEARSAETGRNDVFDNLYPFYAELSLGEQFQTFDTLIIDEAQDLVCESNLAVFNLLVNGGLAGGRWALFGDFTRQAIYGNRGIPRGDSEAVDLVRQYCPHATVIPLNLNCRNTHQIGEETALLSGFNSLPYTLSQAQGLAVDYRYWRNRKEETIELEKAIRKLLAEGIAPSDIVILSPYRFKESDVRQIAENIGCTACDVQDLAGDPDDCIVFSTIHSFKGMESPAIVLTGITEISSDEQRSLLYIGMSRARSHLVVVINGNIKKRIPELMKTRFSKEWTEK
jgi:hypothetical protein